ncbi:hypothetical protein CDAR_487381 [Caerostris darwini]|uniref:Uncharacterized protein n=1 Tax=Caerostris darwini TaxID=1538125 RepID=A0AAV4MYX4_9ARAC|nr:hypothetical protein CDAR_487381 [Caerostris darwini]
MSAVNVKGLTFSREFVSEVFTILFPMQGEFNPNAAANASKLSNKMKNGILSLVYRHLIELYFLYSFEEFAFCKTLNDETFREMLEEMKKDFKEDFDCTEFLYFCLVVSVYCVIAFERNCPNAKKHAARAIYDTLKYFEDMGQFTDETWVELEACLQSMIADL